MNSFDPLNTGLLDLLYELRDTDMRLIVGGGYGLYLKRQHLRQSKTRTFFDTYPGERSTEDIDLFLQTEILADFPTLMRDALKRANYEDMPEREYWQFYKIIPQLDVSDAPEMLVKLDLLTPQPAEHYLQQKRVRIDSGSRRVLRVKPGQKGILLHGHLTKEALAIENSPIEVELNGQRSTGEKFTASILLPQAFTYLVMKLFAFRDREFDRNDPEQAMKHAFDLYPIVAMMTENEYHQAQQMTREHQRNDLFHTAADIVGTHFADVEARGMLRIREHPQFKKDFELTEFMKVLAEVFTRE